MENEITVKGNGMLVRIGDAARRLGVSSYVVRKLIQQGRLTGIGFGRSERKNYITSESISTLMGGLENV